MERAGSLVVEYPVIFPHIRDYDRSTVHIRVSGARLAFWRVVATSSSREAFFACDFVSCASRVFSSDTGFLSAGLRRNGWESPDNHSFFESVVRSFSDAASSGIDGSAEGARYPDGMPCAGAWYRISRPSEFPVGNRAVPFSGEWFRLGEGNCGRHHRLGPHLAASSDLEHFFHASSGRKILEAIASSRVSGFLLHRFSPVFHGTIRPIDRALS